MRPRRSSKWESQVENSGRPTGACGGCGSIEGGAGWLGLGLGTWDLGELGDGPWGGPCRSQKPEATQILGGGLMRRAWDPSLLEFVATSNSIQFSFNFLHLDTEAPGLATIDLVFQKLLSQAEVHLHESALSRRFATLTRSMSTLNWLTGLERALLRSPSPDLT